MDPARCSFEDFWALFDCPGRSSRVSAGALLAHRRHETSYKISRDATTASENPQRGPVRASMHSAKQVRQLPTSPSKTTKAIQDAPQNPGMRSILEPPARRTALWRARQRVSRAILPLSTRCCPATPLPQARWRICAAAQLDILLFG